MTDSTAECPSCKRAFAAAVPVCPFCGARRGASPQPTRPAARPPTPTRSRQEPPKRVCPRCEGAPGSGSFTVQTREHKETSFFTGKRRYLVRTGQIRGICADCVSAIERRRYFADLLCLAPLVILFVLGVFLDSKALFVLLVLYLLYIVSELGDNWADDLSYGSNLKAQLAPLAPPGDPGTLRMPVGALHILIRVGALPAGLVTVFLVGSSLAGHRNPKAVVAPVATSAAATEDRITAARSFLASATEVAVPLSARALASRELQGAVGVLSLDDVWELAEMRDSEVDGRRVKELKVYAHTTAAPPNVAYQPLSGSQVASLFVRTHADTLVIEGLGAPLTLDHYEAAGVAKTLPDAEPVSAKIVRGR